MKRLLGAMSAAVDTDKLRVEVLVDRQGREDFGEVVPVENMHQVGDGQEGVLRTDWLTSAFVRKLEPDLYYRPTGQLPLAPMPCPAMVGVADLNFRWLKTPHLKRLYKEISYRRSFRVARRIVCVSNFTRDDVINQFGISPKKLEVIHHGTSALPAAAPLELGLGEFWLTFGHQAHKNVELCLEALKRRKSSHAQESLVVVGRSGHIEKVLKPMARHLGLEGRVHFIGHVSDSQLSGLYRTAKGLLFVSRFEGFGLPLLEAMQARCPVIASNVCSMPEVAGDAALLISPDDAQSLVLSMDRIDANKDFAADLVARGLKQALRFSWDTAARRTIDVMLAVLSERKEIEQ
jgi:glycosyltransferase involved in cell wall biosynthesis